MLAMVLSLAIVIYTRFSSDLQSTKSCKDQEREVREALTRMGIDHSKAIVIHDEAESGTKVFRDEFARLNGMVESGQIGILAVDDQSRLSRTDNTFAFITDLVYSGGRFISTGEGIDTEQTGWELRVKVMELHNSTTIRELGRRVRRGQLGRVIGLLSAGDQCYGYESFLLDPERAADNRGPKPERGLRIKEDEAKWVRKIFKWFNAGRSIAWIVDELNRQKAPKGHRRRSKRWRRPHVRRILENAKYIGHWVWGSTRTIRNSQGRKKQIPVPEELQVQTDRPDLRIIDDATWAKAQEGLARLKQLYGKKPGQKHRGPKVHHTAVYPSGLLNGMVFCSKCGARMWQQASGPRLYLGCPNRGTTDGCCELTTTVPLKKAEQALLDLLTELLTSWPEWLDRALDVMRQEIQNVAQRIPDELASDQRQLRELETRIANLVDALADGRVQSQAVLERLDSAEREADRLRNSIEVAEKALSAPLEMPDEEWIREQLSKMSSVIQEGGYEAALLLRRLIGRIEVEQVIAPGKTRGYPRLRFRINGWETLKTILHSAGRLAALDGILHHQSEDETAEEFVIDLGGPTLMDRWAPRIAEMRAQGVKWTEIVEITGLDLNRAYIAWKRHADACEISGDTDANPPDGSGPTDDDTPDDNESSEAA